MSVQCFDLVDDQIMRIRGNKFADQKRWFIYIVWEIFILCGMYNVYRPMQGWYLLSMLSERSRDQLLLTIVGLSGLAALYLKKNVYLDLILDFLF